MSQIQEQETETKRSIKDILADNPLYSLAAVLVALMLPATLYMGYDLVRGELNPCETIYQESAVGLTTKIKFLETEGELQIGRKKIQELDDRAQAVALNLKTCCTVLDAGQLDPEQFLQCKAKGRDYDERIEELVALVKTAVGKTAAVQPKVVGAKVDPVVTGTAKPRKQAVQQSIAKKVEEAKSVSKKLNKQVKEVRVAQAVAQLKVTPPKNVKVEAQEREPNNDGLTTNEIALGTWVTGAISQNGDDDYYVFTAPDTHRDWLTVEVQNRSTTLRPRFDLYNVEKSHLGEYSNGTYGANVQHSFVSEPNKKYVLAVRGKWGKSTGIYLLKVTSKKSYDTFEPNQSVLTAKDASVGAEVKASIMDGGDIDYFVFKGGKEKQKYSIFVENRSTTLRPRINIYTSTKSHLVEKVNGTYGGDIETVVEIPPGRRFFVAVSARWSKSRGDYRLVVKKQ